MKLDLSFFDLTSAADRDKLLERGLDSGELPKLLDRMLEAMESASEGQYDRGYSDGADSITKAEDAAFTEGKDEGYKDGYEAGFNDGYAQGQHDATE